MLVEIFTSVNQSFEFETHFKDIREVFNYIKNTYGSEVTDKLLQENHYFIGEVGEVKQTLDPIQLLGDLGEYSKLTIIPKVEGEEPISASMIMAAAASMGGGGVVASIGAFSAAGTMIISAGAATAIATVANLAIGIGMSMAVSAIMSPDTSFSGDPAKAQKKSQMFNSATTITEQGGSVPLTYGNPFCGGVLISSGITTRNLV